MEQWEERQFCVKDWDKIPPRSPWLGFGMEKKKPKVCVVCAAVPPVWTGTALWLHVRVFAHVLCGGPSAGLSICRWSRMFEGREGVACFFAPRTAVLRAPLLQSLPYSEIQYYYYFYLRDVSVAPISCHFFNIQGDKPSQHAAQPPCNSRQENTQPVVPDRKTLLAERRPTPLLIG